MYLKKKEIAEESRATHAVFAILNYFIYVPRFLNYNKKEVTIIFDSYYTPL